MCGVHLEAGDYLITGSLDSVGKLSVNICGSLVYAIASLDDTQRKELRKYAALCTNNVSNK